MNQLNIPVGISDFAEIRQNGYYYVDKSAFIGELLKTTATKVTLITRPRRFGKTLTMSMLSDFFDIRKESQSLFDGLEISNNRSLCEKWMNGWPTIFLSFKNVDGLQFEKAYGQLVYELGHVFQQYDFLLESDKITENEKQMFRRIISGKAGEIEISRGLQLLLQLLNKYYNKKVILLLDEYDVPLAKASSNGYYNEMLELMKSIMSTALKDNSNLLMAVVTGCLRISKESIFTGTNNFVSDTINSSRYDEYFGFTQKDINKILEDAGAETQMDLIKKWYDGYHFGEFDVYCPWDVMNYLRDYQHDPKKKPSGYWKNTSDNAIIRSFIDYAGSSITEKLEILLSGGSIVERIDENLTYDYMHSSEENLWSILYLTGYLTRAWEENLEEELPEGTIALTIPNEEIKEIFQTTIVKWFNDSARQWDRIALFDGVWKENSGVITEEMNKLLRRTISYHDYREDFYHAFLAGIFAGAGYRVKFNRESGEGRSDVVVFDAIEGRVAIFEAKYSERLQDMEKDCEQALQQIDEKMYGKEYEEDYDQIICYGISFFKKRCLVKKKDKNE